MNLEALIDGAQKWAAKGVPVFPCDASKRPMEKGGFHTAVTDPDAVDALFRKFSNVSMVGARMGKESGMFAVDIDLYKGDAPKQFMEQMQASGDLPKTRLHETQNGGLHFIYSSLDEWPNLNPCEGVEVKGEGGYIIVPPSKGYKVTRKKVKSAPPSLITKLTVAKRKASSATVTALQQQVTSASNLHDPLAGIAARLAAGGTLLPEIMKVLRQTLEGSAAASEHHERHDRWLQLASDHKGELSRIANTGYTKYSPNIASEEMRSIDTDALAAKAALAEKLGFTGPVTPEGNVEVKQVADYGDDWPFEGTGYFASEDHDLLDQKFVMHPFFAEDETTVLFAEPKVGKTAWNLTASLHVACGMNFGPSLTVHEARPCLYYALEGGRAIKLRIAAWRKDMKEQGTELPDNIPMFVVERNQNFLKEDARLAACNQIIASNNYCIKHLGVGLGMVSIDTLTKAMSSGDQNSVDDTSALFELVGLLREGGVTASIVFVHHKARTGGVRGSTNIEAEPDVLLDVTKGKVHKSDIDIRVSRARSIEDGGIYSFATKTIPLGVTNQGIDLSSFVVVPREGLEDEPEGNMAHAKEYSTALLSLINMIAGTEGGEIPLSAAIKTLQNAGVMPSGATRATSKAAQEFFNTLIGSTGCVYKKHAVSLTTTARGIIKGVLIVAPK